MREFVRWHYSEVLGEVRSEGGDVVAQLLVSGKEDEAGRLLAAAPELLEALQDMLSGWQYIRHTHGDLYGVGWDRAEQKAKGALSKALGQ